MKKNNITKGLALSCFILLIGVFILYRTHAIKPSLSANIKPAAITIHPEDTSKPVSTDTLKRKDSLRRVYMSSSKSIVLTEPRHKPDTPRISIIDTSARKKRTVKQ